MSRLLLEKPWILLLILITIQFALIVIWSRLRSRLWGRAVWTGFAAIPLFVAVSVAVVTPRERIITICRDLAAMVDDGDITSIGEHLAEDFNAGGYGSEEFLQRLESRLTIYHVDNARLRGFEVTLSGRSEATAVFGAICSVRSADGFLDRLFTRWRLTVRRNGQNWKVAQVESLPTPLLPFRDVTAWLE